MEDYIQEASKYFTTEQWSEFDKNERFKYGAIFYIYFACINLEIEIEVPKFIKTDKTCNKLMKKRNLIYLEVTDFYPKQENASEAFEKLERIIYFCHYCGLTFKFKKIRDCHLEFCGKRFTTHPKKKVYFCKKCEFCTYQFRSLAQHKTTHPKKIVNVIKYSCNMCRKTFKGKGYLSFHKKMKHPTKITEYNCEYCAYNTHIKGLLKRHMRIHLDKTDKRAKVFNCMKCGNCYLNKSDLISHINHIHFNIKQYRCGICDYSTAYESNLKKHLVTHTNIKPYKCSECIYKSRTKGDLKKHWERRHYFLKFEDEVKA